MDYRLVVLAHCSWIDYSSLQTSENFHHISQQQEVEETDFRASDLTTQIPHHFYYLIYLCLFTGRYWLLQQLVTLCRSKFLAILSPNSRVRIGGWLRCFSYLAFGVASS